jgi:endogenous inhibitor of DNA gyrase (YacG/DUF329 family)
MSPSSGPLKASCPICGKATATEFTPFCSKRCADIDLHHWLTGRYAIPAVEADQEELAGDESEPPRST